MNQMNICCLLNQTLFQHLCTNWKKKQKKKERTKKKKKQESWEWVYLQWMQSNWSNGYMPAWQKPEREEKESRQRENATGHWVTKYQNVFWTKHFKSDFKSVSKKRKLSTSSTDDTWISVHPEMTSLCCLNIWHFFLSFFHFSQNNFQRNTIKIWSLPLAEKQTVAQPGQHNCIETH